MSRPDAQAAYAQRLGGDLQGTRGDPVVVWRSASGAVVVRLEVTRWGVVCAWDDAWSEAPPTDAALAAVRRRGGRALAKINGYRLHTEWLDDLEPDAALRCWDMKAQRHCITPVSELLAGFARWQRTRKRITIHELAQRP